jgi:hypothetical protein
VDFNPGAMHSHHYRCVMRARVIPDAGMPSGYQNYTVLIGKTKSETQRQRCVLSVMPESDTHARTISARGS